MSGKCSCSTLNACSQPCHTYNISTSLLYFCLQCDCGYQIQPSSISEITCVSNVTFFHNCFSWVDVIFCPNPIGSVSCEFNLQTICYTKSRQCLNVAGCCGCVVCYNNTTYRYIVKFDNKLNQWSKRIISDVKLASAAGRRRLPWRSCSCPWRRQWKRWTSDVTTGPLVWCADPTLAQT